MGASNCKGSVGPSHGTVEPPAANNSHHRDTRKYLTVGEIRFDGYGSPSWDSPFMLVDSEVDMGKLWEDVKSKLVSSEPQLIISVTGGAERYVPTFALQLQALITEDLMNAAVTKGAWIITGGIAKGVMKLVGEAVAVRSRLETQKGNSIVALGIVSLDNMAKKERLKVKTQNADELVKFKFCKDKGKEGEKKGEDEGEYLDHNHTHFLLVKSESNDKEIIDIRSRLETHILKDIPLVLIVVEGGFNTLKHVQQAIANNCPVVVIDGSGRAADLISKAVDKHDHSDEDLKKKLDAKTEERKEALEILKECSRKKGLFTIFKLAEMESGKDLQHCILEAAFKNSKSADTSAEISEKATYIGKGLELAVAWKQCDFARQYILPLMPEEKKKEILWKPMVAAMATNQHDFQKLFLDNGMEPKTFVTNMILKELYLRSFDESGPLGEMIKNFVVAKCCVRTPCIVLQDCCTEQLEVLPFINEVVVDLLQDDSFSFYPDNQAGANDLEHPDRDLFLWAVLFNRQELAERFWKTGRDHLGGALLASALLKKLSKRAEEREMVDLSEDLKKQSTVWERLAVSVLSECYSRDRKLAQTLLVREQLHWTPSTTANTTTKNRPPTLLNIVESYKMMEFAGSMACQTKLSESWRGRLACSLSDWKVLLCIFVPILLITLKFTNPKATSKNQGSSTRDQASNGSGDKDQDELLGTKLCIPGSCDPSTCIISVFKAVYYYCTAPVTKFYYNILSYVAFLVLSSYFVLVELKPESSTPVEYLVWFWVSSMILQEGREMFCLDRLSLKYRVKFYLNNVWNRFDLAQYVLFVVSVVLRLVLPAVGGDFKWVRAFYGVTLVSSFLRLLQFLYLSKNVGPKVYMIKKMLADVLYFLIIPLVFVIGFGVAYHANMFPEAPLDWNIPINIIYYPYFQIFGELFLDTMRGEDVDGCQRNETLWRQDTSNRCPESSRIIQFLMLGIYLIVTNILLVNLLIAMFSHTFQKVESNPKRVWFNNRLSLVHEYIRRPALPPPLIILDHVFSVIHWVVCRCHSCCKWCEDHDSLRMKLSPEEHQFFTYFERDAVLYAIKSGKITPIADRRGRKPA